MQCRIHPDEEAFAGCEKFGVGYCRLCCEGTAATDECGCTSPRQHCRFRSRCLVWELSRERHKAEKDD